MVISADTSFLYSLYGNDSNTPAAVDWVTANPLPICISRFNRFELRNSLRFAECRGFLRPQGSAAAWLLLFDTAISDGRLINTACDLDSILNEANRLSVTHTLTGGHRAFDILHIAAAKLIGADHFLTFDKNQRQLAESQGLVVPI